MAEDDYNYKKAYLREKSARDQLETLLQQKYQLHYDDRSSEVTSESFILSYFENTCEIILIEKVKKSR